MELSPVVLVQTPFGSARAHQDNYNAKCHQTIHQASKEWIGDGTFKCTPLKGVHQVLVLHRVTLSARCAHCLWWVLGGQSEKHYSAMFSILQLLLDDSSIAPEFFALDFEQPTLSAARKAFPGSIICGCYFHMR